MAGTLVLDTLQNGAGTASTSADNVINGCAKAWVNFNGTTSPGTIRAQYNVSSVTKNGTGDYTVNFTNAMPNANYSFSATTEGAAVATENNNNVLRTTTQIRMNTLASSNGSAIDRAQINAAIFSS